MIHASKPDFEVNSDAVVNVLLIALIDPDFSGQK
jgi:hypothetical protein